MIDHILQVNVELLPLTEEIEITVEDGVGGGGGGRLPNYKGDYQVTPKIDQIVLPTKNKSMTDDVTVFQIPYKEVKNPQGGSTVTIGLE